MTLRKKTLLLMGIVLILTFVMLLAISRTILFENYAALEKRFMQKDVNQVLNIVMDDLMRLKSTTEDWAFWDDTYRFVQDKNKGFIEANLLDDTFSTLRLQFLAVYDTQGRLVYEKSLDYDLTKPIPFPKELLRLPIPVSDDRQGSIGMLGLNSYGPVLFAAKPILTSKLEGPAHGTLLMGRLLNNSEISRIARITHLDLSIYPIGSRRIILELQEDSGNLRRDNVVVRSLSPDKAAAYTVIKDPSGASIGILKVEAPREIYRQAKNSVLWFTVCLLIIGIIFAFSVTFLLERTVLSRIARLDASVTEIGDSHDLTTRFNMTGKDELANLANSMNHMLSALNDAQKDIQASEAKLRAMFHNTPTPIFVIDHETMGITDANPAGVNFFECTYDEILQKKCWEKENIAEALRGTTGALAAPKTLEVDCDVHENTKTLLLNLVPIAIGEKTLVYAIGQDITERKQMEEQLLDLSMYDTLTGFCNRIYFERELSRYSGENQPLAVLRCDVDGLKLINESLGTKAGDEVILTLANILKDSMCDGALIARTGGDDFTALMPGAAMEQVEEAVRLIRNGIAKYNANHFELPISVSVGFSAGLTGPEELIKEAERNMGREKLHRNLSARNAMVQALTKAMEARDFVTEGHADRMQKLVMDLGAAFGLPRHRVMELGLLAKFHDIGKVGIPDRILFKEKSLTEEEKKEMERHCEIGYRIAQSTPDLAPIADWILKHQEWWNGNGYPLNLYGDEIPFECRLISIIDAFDAMTNDRPYRKALTQEAALAEIERCSGVQFDPKIVEKFLKLMRERH